MKKSVNPAELQTVMAWFAPIRVMTRLGIITPGTKLMSDVGGFGGCPAGNSWRYVGVVALRPVTFMPTAVLATGGMVTSRLAPGQVASPGPRGVDRRLS